MAVNLPKSLQFVEYRPSMVGIPTQSVARLYDRLDKEALRTEAAANKVQTALANHIAVANEGDKPYLNDLLGKVDGIIDQASSEKNLPGYAKQIRKLIGDIGASPEYATVRNNARLAEEYRKTNLTLTTQFGAENVANSGDDPSNFSSFGPNGELRQFQGFATKRPDYLKGMDQIYMANKDIVANEGALDEFINSNEAFANYMKTAAGRVHVNEVAQQMTGVPMNRIQDEAQAAAVVEQMNGILRDAGVRYIKTAAAGNQAERYKHLQGKGIVSSGIANQTLTDGTEEADATIAVFDDRVKNTALDDQLTAFVSSDPEVLLYDKASGTDSFERKGGVQSDQIVSSKLTSAIGPNGRPLIQVEYNDQTGKDGDRGIGYYEISQEDLGFLPEVVADETLFQLRNYSTEATRGSMAPAISNIYFPELNTLDKEGSSDAITSDAANIEVRKVSNGYAIYNLDGTPRQLDGNDLVYRTVKDVREYVGNKIINQQ